MTQDYKIGQFEGRCREILSAFKATDQKHEINMQRIKVVEDEFNISLPKQIEALKTSVWQHLTAESQQQQSAILAIKNPIEEFRLDILTSNKNVKTLHQGAQEGRLEIGRLQEMITQLEEKSEQRLQGSHESDIFIDIQSIMNTISDNRVQVEATLKRLEEILNKVVNFNINVQPKQVTNQINDVLCGFLNAD